MSAALRLNAFNLTRGLVIETPEYQDKIVILNVRRDTNSERVWVFGRRYVNGFTQFPVAIDFDFNDIALVVGNSINPDDRDDTDFGIPD